MGNTEFYRNAKAYDIAFNDRYFDEECDFLEWCLTKHSKLGKKKLAEKSFLELGCGPGKHAREFSSRGWNSIGLDLSEEMVVYAKEESEKEGNPIKTIATDMSKFKLKKPVILSATLMESISHLVTNEQIISHFKSIAKSMVSGGIYVIEATHPMFFFPDEEANTWTTKENKTKVDVTFGLPTDKYNSVTQQWSVTTRMKITEPDGKVYKSESVGQVRWYLLQEMKALIELSGVFDKYWVYGSMYNIPPKDIDETEDSDAMVIVLRVK